MLKLLPIKSSSCLNQMSKKILLTCMAVVFMTAASSSQQPQFNTTQYRGAFAKEKLTVSNSVKTLTSSVYAPTTCATITSQCKADYALVSVETDCLRYWPTGDNPTTTDGHKMCDGTQFYIYGLHNITNLKMIRVTTDVTIQVSYYRFFTNSQ